jgi:hypothetical protein
MFWKITIHDVGAQMRGVSSVETEFTGRMDQILFGIRTQQRYTEEQCI